MVNLNKMLPSEDINKNIKEDNEKIKSNINDLENNELKYDKIPKELNEIGWFLNKNELLITYDYRPEWWDEQENNPQVNNEFFFSVKKISSEEYEICWKTRDEGATDTYAISEIFITKKFINVSDDNRTRKLGQNAALGNLPRDKRSIKDFWNKLITPVNKYGIGSILSKNYEVLLLKGYEESENSSVFKTFNDYPDNIQEEVLKIIEAGDIINELLKVSNITHQGDIKTLKLLFLSYQSLFIDEPVHQKLGGKTGAGKTDVVETSIATVPEQYVFKFRNPSPKFIHYSCENFNKDYNIIINDDVKLGSDMIELNKSITDPNDKEKTHNTVIDGKAKSFKLPGEYLGIYNLAKAIEDEEFLNRLFLNDVAEDNDKNGLKEKIKQNVNLGVKDSELLNSIRFILKAVWQWHIDEEIRVFNPYLIFLDVENKNNRNVSSITKLIKANSFFKYSERAKINNVVIGSLEDLKEVLELWEDKSLVQDYKLDPKQVEILKILECYEEEDIRKIQNDFLEDPTKVRQEVNTISVLTTKLGISYSTMQRLIYGSKEGTQVGLKGMGLINTFSLNDDNKKAGTVVSINPEYKNDIGRLKSGLDINHLNQILKVYTFTTLNSKKKLVYSFLLFNQIIINNIEEKEINLFIESLSYEVNTYDDVVKLLNDVKEKLSDKFSDDKDFSDLSYKELENVFSIFHRNTNFGERKKTSENSLNEDSLNTTNNPKKMDKVVKGFKANEDIKISIKNGVEKILKNNEESSISQLIKELPVYDEDSDSNYHIVNKVIKELAKNDKIAIYNNTVTNKKPVEVFQNFIFKLLNNGNSYTSEELAKAMPDISPDLESTESRLEKIEDLTKKGLLFLSDNQLVMSDDLKNIFRGDSK